MLFDKDFLTQVSEDPVGAGIAVCKRVQGTLVEDQPWSPDEYDALLEGYALLQVMKEGALIPVVVQDEDLVGELDDDCRRLARYIREMRSALEAHSRESNLEKLKSRFAQGLGVGFAYEFSQADLNRIQTLIDELRNQVESSTLFAKEHQARLLRRLEQLRRELRKRVSDLDHFWGLIGDAGVALGRCGTAAKPFVERITEITEIVWNTQKQAEGLPSSISMPLLNSEKLSESVE
jgi:hypothetical protein